MIIISDLNLLCSSNIKVITGRVELQGQIKFYSNNAVGFDGGAIYLLSYSQLFLQNDTQLEFINNTGRSVLFNMYVLLYTHVSYNVSLCMADQRVKI